MKRIALIIIWIGKFKNYNDFWLKSIEKNPSVDFIVFTDQQTNTILPPPNLKIVHTSFDKLAQDFQSRFDFKVSIPQSYKFCDFKPAYGEIFQEYLAGYDFWGHCDNDLIFGDIRRFITDKILLQYDKILARGHFTLYRNTPEINAVYKKHPLCHTVFSSPQNFCFDEWPGISRYWNDNLKEKFYNEIVFDDIHYLKHNFITVHKVLLDKGRTNFVYSYENGKLFRVFLFENEVHKEETMYVHFQKRRLKVTTQANDYFTIIPNKIIAYQKNITPAFLKKKAKKKLFYPQYFQIKYTSFKRKLKALLQK